MRQDGDEKEARKSPKTTMHNVQLNFFNQDHNKPQRKKKKSVRGKEEVTNGEKERRDCLIRTDRPIKRREGGEKM